MHKFYFNECLPPCDNQSHFVSLLCNTLHELNKLRQKNLGIDSAVITEKLPSEMFIGNQYSLHHSVEMIGDKELRRYAFSVFTKYPVDTNFSISEEVQSELIECNYFLVAAPHQFDALNLAIAEKNEGVLFTVALHGELKKDTLRLQSNDTENTLDIYNLYGFEENTSAIEQRLKQLNAERLSNFDKLCFVLGEHRMKDSFEKEFQALAIAEQLAIIELFQQAKDRNLASFFFADGKMIGDVTQQNSKVRVLELRVYKPTALRFILMKRREFRMFQTLVSKQKSRIPI